MCRWGYHHTKSITIFVHPQHANWHCARCGMNYPVCQLFDAGGEDWTESMLCVACYRIWDKKKIIEGLRSRATRPRTMEVVAQ